MSGCWVFVCGPSGVGKDSVIALARRALGGRGDIVFAQRLITRPAQNGSDHEPATEAQFQRLRDGAGLAWHWNAHGFSYGVPMRYAHQVGWGRIVVVNASREHAATVGHDPLIHTVLVTAPREKLLARLQSRGREQPEAVAQRLLRGERLPLLKADLVIDNGGRPEAAAAVLQRHLELLAGFPVAAL
jgi:ribose 1,5-bisphosphokinase